MYWKPVARAPTSSADARPAAISFSTSLQSRVALNALMAREGEGMADIVRGIVESG